MAPASLLFFDVERVQPEVVYLAAMYVVSGILFILSETTGRMRLGYSKFSRKHDAFPVPSKVAMFFAYAPSAAIAAFTAIKVASGEWAALSSTTDSFRTLLVAAVLFAHFGKRTAEVLFVHIYSGTMDGLTVVAIGGIYIAATVSIIYAQLIAQTLKVSPQYDTTLIGLGLFVIGTLINLHHHRLLANLRKPSSSSSAHAKKTDGAAVNKSSSSTAAYSVPRGALFELVTCPHYFGECVAFLGIALVAQTAVAASIAFTVWCYLPSRSVSTRQWYLANVKGYSPSRKAIIPYIL